MKVAVVGAGFTGLSAALHLVKQEIKVTVFEKEKSLGGLASTFKKPGWQWAMEKHYHHWFTNDRHALSLIKDLGLADDLLIPTPVTSIYYQSKIYPFNSPGDVLSFSALSLIDRFRTGLVLAYLKMLPPSIAVNLEKYTAYSWLLNYFGPSTFRVLWQPLLIGKFGDYAPKVNMAWFWARIKKRTPKLAYLRGGYHRLLTEMARAIKQSGGQIVLGEPFDTGKMKNFDKTVFTVPSAVFARLFPELPRKYRRKLETIPHLHALNLLLSTKEKFLQSSYWLNINDRSLPFLGIIAHTNFVDKKYYGSNHLTWIGNYLPPNHHYLKMSKEELFTIYKPYLKKINPRFNFQRLTTNDYELFFGSYAQPVFGINYSKVKPEFKTSLKNVYLANMDMVYPWDRGTNYAIELGYKVAQLLESEGKI